MPGAESHAVSNCCIYAHATSLADVTHGLPHSFNALCRGKCSAALLPWQYAARWMLSMGTNWGGG